MLKSQDENANCLYFTPWINFLNTPSNGTEFLILILFRFSYYTSSLLVSSMMHINLLKLEVLALQYSHSHNSIWLSLRIVFANYVTILCIHMTASRKQFVSIEKCIRHLFARPLVTISRILNLHVVYYYTLGIIMAKRLRSQMPLVWKYKPNNKH